MNISILDAAKANPDLIVSIKLGDLLEANELLLEKSKKDLKESLQQEQTETYPSKQKVASMLSVSVPTLWRWSKSGYLRPITVGGKIRYRMSDVKKILDKQY